MYGNFYTYADLGRMKIGEIVDKRDEKISKVRENERLSIADKIKAIKDIEIETKEEVQKMNINNFDSIGVKNYCCRLQISDAVRQAGIWRAYDDDDNVVALDLHYDPEEYYVIQ